MRLAELIGALSLAADLSSGMPSEKGLRSVVIASRLGRRLGWSTEALTELFWVAALRPVGCVGWSAEGARYSAGDDISLRKTMAYVDPSDPLTLVRSVVTGIAPEAPLLDKAISDERVPLDRRVLYALEGLAGLRHGEAAGLRWRHYDPAFAPLGRLTVATSYDKGRTKTGRTRFMPAHPTLAALLAEWKLGHWSAEFGREPQADDLVVPLPHDPPKKQARRNPRAGGMRNKSDSFKRLSADLKLLALRHRRGHDLRRTMISLARMDGARADLLQVCTHNPGKGMGTIDLYTSYDWASLCAEVAKLKVTRTQRAQVIPFGTVLVQQR